MERPLDEDSLFLMDEGRYNDVEMDFEMQLTASPSAVEEQDEGIQEQNVQNEELTDVRHSQQVTDNDRKHFGDASEWMTPKPLQYKKCVKMFGNVGKLFKLYDKRRDCFNEGVHKQIQAGIDGTTGLPAASVVAQSLGGYHDEDYGEVITYTGQGGDENTDQTLTKYNACLVLNHEQKVPVRLVRGYQLDSPFAPKEGYRYDGLYWITGYWSEENGPNKAKVYKFRLVRLEGQGEIPKVEGWKPKDVKRISRMQYRGKREQAIDTLKKTKKRRRNSPQTIGRPSCSRLSNVQRSLILRTLNPEVPERFISVSEDKFVSNTPCINREEGIDMDKHGDFIIERDVEATRPLVYSDQWQNTYTNIPVIMRTVAMNADRIVQRCKNNEIYQPKDEEMNITGQKIDTISGLVDIPVIEQDINIKVLLAMMDADVTSFENITECVEKIADLELCRKKYFETMLGDAYYTMIERSVSNQVRIRTQIKKLREM